VPREVIGDEEERRLAPRVGERCGDEHQSGRGHEVDDERHADRLHLGTVLHADHQRPRAGRGGAEQEEEADRLLVQPEPHAHEAQGDRQQDFTTVRKTGTASFLPVTPPWPSWA
jgi:hypothetical protein